jgi:hypothetical protein
MEHPILLLQARHMYYDFTVGCEGIIFFTHKFNFDAREDAAGAIISATQI